MGFRTWERRYRDDTGLLMRRRHVEVCAGSRRLRLELPALPALGARERERLLDRKFTREKVLAQRAKRQERLGRRLE